MPARIRTTFTCDGCGLVAETEQEDIERESALPPGWRNAYLPSRGRGYVHGRACAEKLLRADFDADWGGALDWMFKPGTGEH